MWNRMLFAFICFVSVNARAQAALTETEEKWLHAGWPVIMYAKNLSLPIDIVVQPQPTPGDVPLAMGFEAGRCKLVLSIRGNPSAESILANIPAPQFDAVIEAMTAHELGHCWRNVEGSWHALPAGFVETGKVIGTSKEVSELWQEMRATRREEGFADLVGLAWIHDHHPEQYAQVYAWFEQVRQEQPVDGSYHDTRVWLGLAKDGFAFNDGATLFEQARVLWQKGLLMPDQKGNDALAAQF